jgi:hypothetical protein
MDTGIKILVVGGMVNLVVGALSGIPMGLVRMQGADAAPKYLTMLHLGGLMQGPILIGVGFALTMSTLTSWINTLAAVLLVAASALLFTKDFLNWRQGVQDEFAEKSVGLTLGNIFGPIHIAGIALATVAVLSGL